MKIRFVFDPDQSAPFDSHLRCHFVGTISPPVIPTSGRPIDLTGVDGHDVVIVNKPNYSPRPSGGAFFLNPSEPDRKSLMPIAGAYKTRLALWNELHRRCLNEVIP